MPSALDPGALVAGRFVVEATLGQGGMGAVYRVLDQRTGRRLALKQLRTDSHSGATAALMTTQFEREYHTLSQLAHPSIIGVYDYGVDGTTLFYTMELLDGQDLRERGRLPWREACAVLRDVASSLAIMHSRRVLHRDISARNVRCTSTGKAKLIDFGAMAPMGLVRHVVGTAPFVPPEATQMQMLDGRSDLYALGVLAYWVLTGRYPYPARTLAELPDLWRNLPPSPRRYDAQIPEALDQLVMELIELDCRARPVSAPEVMERLSGIAGLPLDELPEVSRAYLVAPTLIGREAELHAVRTRLVGAMQGAGGSGFSIEGAEGTGRSRLLDACVLEAKLLGATVLRADAADAEGGDYAVAKALCEGLFDAWPELARKCARPMASVLAALLPEQFPGHEPSLGAATSLRPSIVSLSPDVLSLPPESLIDAAHSLRPAAVVSSRPPPKTSSASKAPAAPMLQGALRDFVLAIARTKHIVIAVDDLDAIDAASAALLGALVSGAKRRRLTVIGCVRTGTPPSAALALFRELAQPIVLSPLSLQQSESLLRAVFGDAGRLATLNERVFAISGGNPRWTMALCERLVDRGLARYEAGSWRLPLEISHADLPASLAQALSARIETLPSDARELAEALAYCDPTQLGVDRYRLLTRHCDKSRTYTALETLVMSGILRAQGDRYRFTTHGMRQALRDGVDPAHVSEMHVAIARAHEQCDDPWRVPYHLLLAGHDAEGMAHLERLGEDPRLYTSKVFADALNAAVVAAERLGLPLGILLNVRRGALSIAMHRADYVRFKQLGGPLLARLLCDSGLSDHDEVDRGLGPDARLREAQARALARHQMTPEHERGFPPLQAMRLLREVGLNFAGMASAAQELELVEAVPALDPLFPIMPALRITQLQLDFQRHLQAGRPHLAEETSQKLLALLDQADVLGLEPDLARSARHWELHNQGLFAAGRGDPAALEWVAEIGNEPYIRANARRVRMAYELMHGNVEAAVALRHRAELLALEDGNVTIMPGTTTRLELMVYSFTDDVIGVKRTMERLEPMAQRFPNWVPTWQIARSQYLRIQGDAAGALAVLAGVLDVIAPGRHLDWGLAVTLHVGLLHGLDRSAEAATRGAAYIADCERERLEPTRIGLLRMVGEALTRLGRPLEALPLIEEHVATLQAQKTSGLLLGLAYEARARLAVATHDEPAVRRYATLCAEQYKGARNPALNTKYRGLMREAELAGIALSTGLQDAVSVGGSPLSLELQRASQLADHTLSSRLLGCEGREERALAALRVLIENAGAAGGFLFDVESGQPELLARIEEELPSVDFLRLVAGCIASRGARDDDLATSFESPADEVAPVHLSHSGRVYEPTSLTREPGLLALLRFTGPARSAVRRELYDAVIAALEE